MTTFVHTLGATGIPTTTAVGDAASDAVPSGDNGSVAMGGGEDHGAAEPVMKVTEAQLDAAGVDQAWRDYCSHLLIPLNKCRRANLFSPWKCVDERHGYEKCQYDHYLRRVREMTEQHAAAKRAAKSASTPPADDDE